MSSKNDYVGSVFLMRTFRTNLVYKCELGFAVLLFGLSLMEFLYYDSFFISIIMIIYSVIFFLLYFELYFGCVYNCIALLRLHTYSAGIIALISWIYVLIPILFIPYLQYSTEDNYRLLCEYYACLIICGSLLATFAMTSFGKTIEIKSVELSSIDYLRKLLAKSFELFEDVQSEGRKYDLKPKDVFSLS